MLQNPRYQRIFCLLLFSCWHFLYAQEIYIPDSIVTNCPERISKLEEKLKEKSKQFSSLNSSERDYISKRYKDKIEYFKNEISDGDFLINSPLEKHVNDLLNIIVQSNNILDQNYTVYISRDPVPNAASTGEGIIVVNLGLLNKLDNDAQLVYILCHEISHDHLHHVDDNILSKAKKYTDKEFNRNLKIASRSYYNRNSNLKKVLINSLIDDMRFNRSEEFIADSTGLEYFRNTGYDLAQSLSTLRLLSRIDTYYDSIPLNIKATLDIPGAKFKDEWLKGDHTSSLGSFEQQKDSLEDSLKTHPDTKLRIAAIQRQLQKDSLSDGKKFLVSEKNFSDLKTIADEETIYSMFLDQNLGRSLFHATLLTQQQPENKFARTMLAWAFSRLSYLQINHKMNTEVSLQDITYNESYNKYIDFLNEIGPKDAALLAFKLVYPADEKLLVSEEYYAALIMSAYAGGQKDNFTKYKTEYTTRFPKGKYIEHFKNLNL